MSCSLTKRKLLAELYRENICIVEKAQREFHDWLKSKSYISKEEKKSLDCKSYDEFAAYWTEFLEQAKSDHDLRGGWRRWARKYQSFATSADRFMKDFSPMVELARGAGGPYSGLAVGTICILFRVGFWRWY